MYITVIGVTHSRACCPPLRTNAPRAEVAPGADTRSTRIGRPSSELPSVSSRASAGYCAASSRSRVSISSSVR
jgi:hypothetical protein